MMVIYACPADERLSCPWEGSAISDIKRHFEERHSGLLFHTNSVEIDLNIPNENRLMVCGEDVYLLQSRIKDGTLVIRLRQPQPAPPDKHFDVLLTTETNSYTPHENNPNIISAVLGGWEVDVKLLKTLNGRLESVTCTVLVHEPSPFDFDNIEEIFLEDIDNVSRRIQKLRTQRKDDDGLFDGISQLNFEQLETSRGSRKSSVDEFGRPDSVDYWMSSSFPAISQLSCATCLQDMLPPIYLCVGKHSVCVNCRNDPCKQCDGEVTDQRNSELESVSRNQRHPCKYAKNGCAHTLKYDELRSHEMKCRHCRYTCPIPGCTFDDKYANFVNHMHVHHTSVKVSNSLVNKFAKNDEFCVAVQNCGIFYCRSEQRHDLITWSVSFCGPKEKRFFFELYFPASKEKNSFYLKKQEDAAYVLTKTKLEMKTMKAKKPAELTISGYDN